MQDQYRHAEAEYFNLRGQFDTGRMTREQFDEKLRELIQQDQQGRYWMLGADSGKWYFYDGANWVQGDPYSGTAAPAPPPPVEPHPVPPAAPARVEPVTARPQPAPTASRAAPAVVPTPPSGAPPAVVSTPSSDNTARPFPLVPVLLGLVLLGLAAAAFFAFQNGANLFTTSSPPGTTPLVSALTPAPSAVSLGTQPTEELPTEPPVETLIPPTDEPTEITATTAPTSVPETATPAGPTATVAVPAVPPTVAGIATETRTPAPTLTRIPVTPTLTRIPVTPTPVPPTETALPECPAGVCVTNIAVEPSPPRRNQEIKFNTTFVNSTGETRGFSWLVLLSYAEDGRGLGESNVANINVPPGTSQFQVIYAGVTGKGGCVQLYARAASQDQDKNRTFFPNSDGNPVRTYFEVCPP